MNHIHIYTYHFKLLLGSTLGGRGGGGLWNGMAIGDTKLIVHVVIANYRCSMQAGAHVYIVYTYSTP